MRFWQDDVYMAGRLLQWVVGQSHDHEVEPGDLVMYISSLHAFVGDERMLYQWGGVKDRPKPTYSGLEDDDEDWLGGISG
jgi:hypothetical protein